MRNAAIHQRPTKGQHCPCSCLILTLTLFPARGWCQPAPVPFWFSLLFCFLPEAGANLPLFLSDSHSYSVSCQRLAPTWPCRGNAGCWSSPAGARGSWCTRPACTCARAPWPAALTTCSSERTISSLSSPTGSQRREEQFLERRTLNFCCETKRRIILCRIKQCRVQFRVKRFSFFCYFRQIAADQVFLLWV